ncbi:NAD-dependent epimerase/dehydratase family protein [Candidatus Woesearchaeota archaeon]|nr:NAD-dependent epimerase/dehydratase family protein [Candidatus Woesearchaeota archaeon]
MKVLLTGSTGFLGRYVAQQLAKQKHKFICLVRKTSNPNQVEYLSSLGAEIVYGDMLEPAALEEPIKRVDAIIHLVGIIHDKQQDFVEVHVNGTQNLVNAVNESKIGISTNVTNNKKSALKKSTSVSKFKFIYVSALGVNNIPEKNETKYFKTKYLAEEIVRDAGVNYGLTYTIFRPSIIAGREDKSINTFAAVIKKFPIIGVPAVKGKLQPIYVEDLAYCIVNSLKDKKSDEKNKNKKTTAKKGTAQNTNKNESDNRFCIRQKKTVL